MTTIAEGMSALFERDLKKLREEISLFRNEEDLWALKGEIKNSPGNLAVHLTGSLNFFVGTHIAKNGYVRHRDNEFSDKNIPKEKILSGIDELILMIKNTFATLSDEKMNEEFPIEFIGKMRSVQEVVFIAYGHLNYHLGQINYYRRIIHPAQS